MKENYLILIAVPVESKEHDLSIIWEHGGQIDGYKKKHVCKQNYRKDGAIYNKTTLSGTNLVL